MANLMLTTACNFRCDFCFGAEIIGPGLPASHMSWETFLALLDWVGRTPMPGLDVHLMGGEPTIHPRFADMQREVHRRGWPCTVFSNGSVPLRREVLEESLAFDVRWVVTVNAPETYRPGDFEQLRHNLDVLRRRVVVTLNLTSGATPYEHVLELIQAHDLERQIKIGIALPTLARKNAYVWRPQFEAVAARLIEILGAARAQGVQLEFECGVPYCLFTPEQVAALDGMTVSMCGARLDITPAGDVINCLPLSRVGVHHFTRFSDYGEASRWYRQALRPYRSLGADPECLGCAHLEQGRCHVCLAYGMGQLNRIALPPLPSP